MKMYGVYDAVAKTFATPFFMRSDMEALRAFKNEVNNATSQLHLNAVDYTLFRLAEVDESDGVVVPSKELLANAVSLRKEVA